MCEHISEWYRCFLHLSGGGLELDERRKQPEERRQLWKHLLWEKHFTLSLLCREQMLKFLREVGRGNREFCYSQVSVGGVSMLKPRHRI